MLISGTLARSWSSIMTTTSRVLALSSALLFSAACFAQTSPADPSQKTGEAGKGMAMTGDTDWDALDSNKDGYLTKDELTGSPALVHNFNNIDTSKDGKISMDEWKAYGKNKNMKMTKP
jgi:hypothetical protein